MAEALEKMSKARPRRFRPYPEYKDSGVEWLGEIPVDWAEHKLGYLANATSGGTPSKENLEFWTGEIPWVSPKDMKVRIVLDTVDHVSEQALSETGLHLVEPPAVLIVVRGMILAHTFPVAVTVIPVTINQDMKALRLRSDIDTGFFAYLIDGLSGHFLSLVGEAGHGTKRLRSDLWRSTELFLPEPGEQRAIASFLDCETAKIDGLVEKKERLIELLQEKRTALITRAVTRGLDPNAPMKDSGVEWLGKIPAHWEVCRLRRVISKFVDYRGKTPEKAATGVTLVTAKNIKNQSIDLSLSEEFIPVDIYPKWMVRGFPEEGDVLVTTEAPLGESAQILDTRIALAQRIILLKANKNRITNDYLKYHFAGDPGRMELRTRATGSTALGIKASHLKATLVTVPLMTEQDEITRLIDDGIDKVDLLVAKVREAIDRLKEFRTALISAAVTGKIDVREEAA